MPECVRAYVSNPRCLRSSRQLISRASVRVGKPSKVEGAGKNPVFSSRKFGELLPGPQPIKEVIREDESFRGAFRFAFVYDLLNDAALDTQTRA